MDDLIHLQGPLTEDAVMRTLQARFKEKLNFVIYSSTGKKREFYTYFYFRQTWVLYY